MKISVMCFCFLTARLRNARPTTSRLATSRTRTAPPPQSWRSVRKATPGTVTRRARKESAPWRKTQVRTGYNIPTTHHTKNVHVVYVVKGIYAGGTNWKTYTSFPSKEISDLNKAS